MYQIKVPEAIRQRAFPILYVLVAIVAGLFYLSAREIMKVQTAWVWVVRSDITLNFVVLFFLYGLLCDRYTKGQSKKKSWVIWGGGLAILVLAFKFLGDMPTIFG